MALVSPGCPRPTPKPARAIGVGLDPVSALASPGVPTPRAQTRKGYWGRFWIWCWLLHCWNTSAFLYTYRPLLAPFSVCKGKV